jgi:hypothetical protein
MASGGTLCEIVPTLTFMAARNADSLQATHHARILGSKLIWIDAERTE